jgi:hypothetical protein
MHLGLEYYMPTQKGVSMYIWHAGGSESAKVSFIPIWALQHYDIHIPVHWKNSWCIGEMDNIKFLMQKFQNLCWDKTTNYISLNNFERTQK